MEFLCLKPNPEPGRNVQDYVVTGSIETGESKSQAAAREVLEEIGVQPLRLINLNKSISYTDHLTKEKFIEYCYGAEINRDVKAINEEHLDYKWVDGESFVDAIWWDDSRSDLKKMVNTITLAG